MIGQEALLTRRYHFAAAHRLHAKELPDDVNKKVFGKCNNPNGHGHNYTVFVTVKGHIDSKTGEVTDVAALDEMVTERIVTRFDHRHLNHDPAFLDVVTTGENLVRFIWDELVNHIPVGTLEKIGLIETRDNYFEYRGDIPVSQP
ncbi:MAG: 6-carboxytetrahydropterin synthase [Nitrospirota bacterium]|nr:6-carboxytetrahydropterin synthase [Nitrospirota bacterium]